jgi:hypothetical protein
MVNLVNFLSAQILLSSRALSRDPPFFCAGKASGSRLGAGLTGRLRADFSPALRYSAAAMPQPPQPSPRKLIGIALILLLIAFWTGFVVMLAPFVSRWPILVQAPYYLIMGTIWIIPLKPLIRWSQSGHFRAPRV